MLRESKGTAQSRSIMLNLSAPAGAALLRLLLVLCAASALLISSTSAIGVNFGQVGNDLPANDVVLQLVQSTTIKKVKIYDANAGVLTTFAGSGIDFVIAADNDEIQPVANTAGYALQWVQTNVAAYPNTSIVGVALGNEVLSYEPQLIPFLVPAMQNLQAALVSLGLDSKVKVSTPNSLGIVAQSFPPSYGEFHYYSGNVMSPLLDFLAQTGAPFMVNIYPYFAYAAAPQNISLDYVLFSPSAVPVYDDGSGLNYTNMFDAQVDAVYAAISKMGYNNVTLAVTETGWPSAGDPDQAGADVANAQLYNANLVTHIESGVGTPARPGVTVDTYIFALFNEDMKPGPTSERNFGLFNPDGTPVYNSGLTVSPEWYTPPSAYPPPPPVVVVPPVSDWPPPPVTVLPPVSSWPPPPPVTVLPPVTSWSPPPPPVTVLPPVTSWSPPPPPIALPPTIISSPPPPIALPPTAVWSPPPPVYGVPLPPPVALPPPAVYSPPPVATAPQPPPVYWPPPVVWSPPPVAAAPQPPPIGWSPPPPVVIVTPPDGWSPPPPPVIIAPAWGPAYSPPPPWDPATPSPDPTTPSPDPTTPSPTVPVVPGPVGSKVPSWCVAKADADPGQLQIALDWACSTGGADCSLLQSGAACFTPNTLVAHASFAFDSYYQLHSRNSWDCFFSDTAAITTVDPSFAGCPYP